ncbi:alpha/beta fold hydrolase [Candidatus Omnitrophota bacterium]
MNQIIKDAKTGMCYREWIAPHPEAVLLLVHGLGGHSGRWTSLAEFFLQEGISSYAIELKGFGQTPELKGHVGSFDQYTEDICRLGELITEKDPGKKIFLLGESMGGLISFMIAALEPGLFGGLVCISPAFSSNLKFTMVEHVKILWNMMLNPEKQFRLPFDSEMCTRDSECRQVLDEDPAEHRFATAGLLRGIALAQMRGAAFARRIETSVLFLLAGQDDLVKSEASEKVFRALKTKGKTLIKYPEMRHALSIGLGREKVFSDILNWLRKT